MRVIWDLSVKPIDSNSCEYTNSVIGTATPQFIEFLTEHGIKYEDAKKAQQADTSDHNSRETPLYAASIERHARARHESVSSE